MKTILTMCLAASLTFAQFTQQGQKLVGTGAVNATKFGRSVAISADGSTAVVGSPQENTRYGAAWVYTRAGGDWIQQGPPLLGAENTEPNLGTTVAISADGNTIIAGDYYGIPAARVFTRTNGVWTQQGSRLSGTSAPSSAVGILVAISADGATAIISAFGDGTAWIFTQSNGVWTQQGEKVTGTGALFSGSLLSVTQGASAALSADGNTALVGGSLDDSGIGAAWIFVRSNGVWTQQGTKLVGSGALSAAQQGISVSLSADGNTASVAGPFDKSSDLTQTIGAVWVFTRANGVWTQQGSKLVGSGSVGNAVNQGSSLSLSSDGATLLVGGAGDDSDNGALWSFTRSNGVWTQQGGKLAGTGAAGNAGLGTSVSVSANGNAVIAGGIYDDNGVGAIWTFARANGVFTQQGLKLVKPQLDGAAGQGKVAVSQDGNTAIVGGNGDKGALGAAWIFTRSSGVWSQQGPKLVGSGSSGLAGPKSSGYVYQGGAVAISSDGNTAVLGGSRDNGQTGTVWVFTRSNGVWSQQGSKLVGTGVEGSSAAQGGSVALSADGNTLAAGGTTDNNLVGAVWIFTRSNGIWTQQGSKIVGAGTAPPFTSFGVVALSGDGGTLIVGGPQDDYSSGLSTGAMWVFTRANGIWTQQGPKLVGTYLFGNRGSSQGLAVALSADGNTAAAGALTDNNGIGAVWIFTRSNGVWSQQGSKLVGTGSQGQSSQGQVALSADGNVLLVGGPGDGRTAFSGGPGAVWLFTRSNGVWSQQGLKFTGSGAVGNASQGAVALSANGTTALVGGSGDNGGNGAVWAFTSSPVVATNITSTPAGASFSVTGSGCSAGSYTAPATLNWTPLSPCNVTFPSPQILTGKQYVLTKWDDSSTNSARVITAPTAPNTYTATFDLPVIIPTAVDSGPLAPSGPTQSLTLKFSHPQGFGQLGVVNALINQYLDGNAACYIAYSQPLQVLYLVNDQGPGSGLSAGLTLGTTGSVSNSQCTIFSTGSSAVGSGNVLTLTLNIAFKNTFTGSKVIYLAAQSVANISSGWQTLGVSLIPDVTITYPRPVAISPSTGTTATQTISFTYQDAADANNLQTAWVLINTAIDGRQACYAAYYAPGNALYLYPDNGDGAAATNIVLSGANTIQNSKCLINAIGSSVVKNGNQLTLNLNITFKPAFTGPLGIWSAVQTLNGAQTSPWKAVGAWLAP